MAKFHLKFLLSSAVCLTTAPLFADPPVPPEGKRWVRNELFSDEFNGDTLDSSKWLDYHPTWKGRPPGIFLPSQVSVKKGFMQIQSKKLKEPVTYKKSVFTMAGGAVVSKSLDASFGYYECRFKAAATTMSTTFWLSTRGKHDLPDGSSYSLELDIQECVGRTGDYQGKHFASGMNSNSHYWHRPRGHRGPTLDIRAKEVRGGTTEDNPSAKFHTYGGWWRDASGVSFYYDNRPAGDMIFTTEIRKNPFDRSMGLLMVSETYPFPWIELPTDEELDNPKVNTCLYDWVRSYTLIDADAEAPADIDQSVKLYRKETVILGLPSKTTSQRVPNFAKFSYKSNQDRDVELQLLDADKKVVARSTHRVLAGHGNLRVATKFEPKPQQNNLVLKACLRETGGKRKILAASISRAPK